MPQASIRCGKSHEGVSKSKKKTKLLLGIHQLNLNALLCVN